MLTRVLRELGKIALAALIVISISCFALYLAIFVFSSRNPEDLAIDTQGNLYTLDSISASVRKFTSEGEHKRTFGERYWPIIGNFGKKLTVDGLGNIYAVDGKLILTKYSPEGDILVTKSLPAYPSDIVADNVGNIYVDYSDVNFFHKFDANGNLLKEWTPPHELADAKSYKLAIDNQNYLYVADSSKDSVYKYDAEGNLLYQTNGVKDLHRAFTVDQNGYFYTFSKEAIIQKWDWNGNLVKTWGGKGEQPGQFEYKYSFSNVYGLTVDERGQLSILYRNNDQAVVQQYTTDGKFIRQWTDGYPSGTSYVLQAVFLFLMFSTAGMVTKIKMTLGSSTVLKPAPLPKYVLAGNYIPELLQDKITQTTAIEGNAKDKAKAENEKARLFMEQALGTFEPSQHKETLTLKGVWNFNVAARTLPLYGFQICLPLIIFVVFTRLRLPWGVGITVTVFSSLVMLTFVGMILVAARRTRNKNRLTKSDLIQLFGINLSVLIIYLLISVAGEFVVKAILDKNDFLYHPLPLLIAGLTGVIAFLTAISNTLKYWLNAPYNEGKYEQALRRFGTMRHIFNTASLWVMEAEAYRRSGKLDEAEKIYYEAMTQAAHHQTVPAMLLLEGLALVRMEQQRYSESLYLLEKSYDLNPERTSPLVYGAENYLRARVNLQRAWYLLGMAETQAQANKEIRSEKAYRLSIGAWARAQRREPEKARSCIEKALASADRKFKPGLAELHLRAALIADMQGNDAVALEHYRQVQLNDPFGVNGTRASRILRFSPVPDKEAVKLP